MKTLVLTSTNFEGELEFRYDFNGYLCFFENRSHMDKLQLAWLLKRIPPTIDDLKAMVKKSKAAKLTEIKHEITFEMFWERYNNKSLSSKKKSLTRWNRMSKAQRAKAYYYIPKYFNSMPAGVAKKYAETYLNSEIWNN